MACVKNLQASGLVDTLEKQILYYGKPFLGICVGMQILAKSGSEGQGHAGLGWINGTVESLDIGDTDLKLPHVGWNEVLPSENSPLFLGLGSQPVFYFVHSYAMVLNDISTVSATCEYGRPFAAAIQYQNIMATQFHPEKSQELGLRLLQNFVRWEP